ncbi:MAG: Na-K-Cl cotransporter [Symploca sp. SIO3C6]|uniref:Na-K-Cl cotransporter n=1 Tax=Symploca sp. SIO1C4 TaxID=2607765 RepID=A0A6B3N9P1_9CYAN|nr:Na-K-Cl cotransporter [Symploca sp. SIO3C6]NER28213.1 Na-K-Cl cotransporter [Symploca sp. SIO1C4]NET07358.1 Na-K-Cl cotransporter [Symploca sp. SIO2B6]
MKFLFRSTQKSTPVNPPEQGTGLGTFGGVYTPSILTILGVIMYLRFGWVVGNVGLLGTLVIVTLSTSITFLTSLSICAIATDRVVRAGGAYYMISRSLGIESGGAIGIPLYFAQAISVALYTIGFAESVVKTFPDLNLQVVALVTTVLVAILAITSAQVAIKTQYLIMAAIALSLISLFFGQHIDPVKINEIQFWGKPDGEDFWVVFAVFFPAVTGIMAGVNMSGDLEDPIRSIPTGTLAAVGTGYVIYMILPVVLAMRATPETLISDPLIMKQMSVWGDAILLGVWGATLSSALGSILGAPRVLQALARDGILPPWLKFLGTGSGPDDEPRVATVITLGLVLVAVAVGDLDLIAPVLSMFFLTTYLVLNLAAGIETLLKSPSFRPSFRVHWLLSLLGVFGCLGVMFLIDSVSTVLAAIIVFSIYIWLERRELESAWGDVRQGIWRALVRQGVMRLDYTPDAKNWRPHLLVFSGAPTRRWNLIELAVFITHNRSLFTISSILPSGSRDAAQQAEMECTIRDYLEKRGVQGLVRLITAPDLFTGAQKMVETYGLGPLVPNTILLGDSEKPARRERYCKMIAKFHKAERNVVIFRDAGNSGFGRRQQIDVWWGGMQANGGLMLILAYLVRTSIEWRDAEIKLKLVVPNDTAAQAARPNLDAMIKQLRIGAKSHVIVANGRPFNEILRRSSEKADLVFLGMAQPGENFSSYYERLQSMATELPATVLVLAAPDFPFSEVLTQEGNVAARN